MLPRKASRHASALLLGITVACGLLGLTGCDPRQFLYFVQPFEPTIPAPGPELKGKRVVVITKGVPGALYDFPILDRELSRELVTILREKVKKIDVVDPDKVYSWDQEHPSWTDPAELAEAFDAQFVAYFEVQQFQTQSPASPGLFEGHSSIHVRVIERDYPKDSKGRPMTDQPMESKVVYEADRDTTFPVRGPLPASAEVTASSFKNRFLSLVAAELSWHFVPHAPGDDIQDVKF
jgi:hypothetical protein